MNRNQSKVPRDGSGEATRGRAKHAPAARDEAGFELPPYHSEDHWEISLRQAWHTLLKQRRTFFGCMAFAVVLAIIVVLLETPQYRAVATVQIESSALKVTKVESIEAITTGGEFMGTQIALLKSRATAQRAVRQLGLTTDAAFQATANRTGLMDSLQALVRRLTPDPRETRSIAERETDTVAQVLEGRVIAPVRNSQLVGVIFDSPDPAIAVRVANGLAQAYMESNLARREDNSQFARNFLEDSLAQLKLKLQDSETAVIRYAQEQGLASIDQNTLLATSNLQQLNTVLSQASAERIRAETRLAQAESSAGASSLESLKSEVLDRMRSQRADLKAEYEAKRAQLKPDHPELLQLARRIAEVEARIREEFRTYADAARGEYAAARANEEQLRKGVAALQAELLDLQARSVKFNILKREADTNRQLYDGLLQRFKEIGVAGDVNANNVMMVDAAQETIRIKPNIPAYLSAGLALGLVLGLTLAFILEALDDTLKSPDDIEAQLGLPMLGVVPKVDADLMESVADDPRSGFSEAYRSLRTGLQFATERGAPRVLLITSALPGEGKSTTAMALARNFAQLGKRVLLIDADMRKPSLHARLSRENTAGLCEFLLGAIPESEVIKPSGEEHLDVVLAGQQPDNPAELLSTASFRAFLAKAAATYDQVILDGPPLLGLADVPTMTNTADGTLLVIHANHSRVGTVRGALKRLGAVRARLVGAVLVRYDSSQAGYGYVYGYGYGYGNGSGNGYDFRRDGAPDSGRSQRKLVERSEL